MDLVAWRDKGGGEPLRSFVDSTNRSAYRIECKQGSLLTLLVAYVGGKEGGIGKTRPYSSKEAFGKRLVASLLEGRPLHREIHIPVMSDSEA